MDEHPLRLQQGLDRLLKDGGVQGLQSLLQAELLPGKPAFRRKALLGRQQFGGGAGGLLLAGHQALEAFVIPAAHPPGKPGQCGAGDPQLFPHVPNGALQKLPGVGGDVIQNFRFAFRQLFGHGGVLDGHGAASLP